MSRIMPFRLDTRRIGDVDVTSFPFQSREEMQARLRLYLKQHFVGEMYPMIEDQGDWSLDQPSLDLIRSTPDHVVEQRQTQLRQTARMLDILASQREPLSEAQKSELALQVRTLYGMLDMVPMEEEWLTEEQEPDPFLREERKDGPDRLLTPYAPTAYE